MRCNRVAETANAYKSKYGGLWHWRASVPWSIPVELLKILVFPNGGANKPHKHGIGHKATREGRQYRPSPIIKHFFVPVFTVVHAAAFAPIAWHRAQGAFIPKGATAERCGLWEKKTRERNKEPDLIEANALPDAWSGEEEREQSWCGKDVNRQE